MGVVHGTLARSEALVRGKKPGPGVGTQGGSRYGSRPEEEFDSWAPEEDPDQGKRSSYKPVERSTPRSNVSVFGSDQDPSGLRSSKTDPGNMDRVQTGAQPESGSGNPRAAGSAAPVPGQTAASCSDGTGRVGRVPTSSTRGRLSVPPGELGNTPGLGNPGTNV